MTYQSSEQTRIYLQVHWLAWLTNFLNCTDAGLSFVMSLSSSLKATRIENMRAGRCFHSSQQSHTNKLAPICRA